MQYVVTDSSRIRRRSGGRAGPPQPCPHYARSGACVGCVWGGDTRQFGAALPRADISLIGGVTVVVASKRLGVLLPVDPPWWCLKGTHLPPQCAGIRLIRPSRRHVCRAFWLVSVPQRTAPRINPRTTVTCRTRFLLPRRLRAAAVSMGMGRARRKYALAVPRA